MNASARMQPHLDFITLAVSDLKAAVAFYRDGLGLPTAGIVGDAYLDETTGARGTIAFFELQGGLMLGLYERANLAKGAAVADAGRSSLEFSLGYLVASKDEVDGLLSRAQAAGARLTAPAHERPWGVYSGYFSDPDAHLWEVAFNERASVAK
jgi:catechol 2,3-dioxygenase-like lactoylglutathione lyase family enzyme